MRQRKNLALIGSGPSAIFFLKHLLDEVDSLRSHLGSVSIFEKSQLTGIGMPYSPQTTDRYNIANISSEELPELPLSFADWLRGQTPQVLKELDLENAEISESKIYSRLAMGRYLNAQYQAIIDRLAESGLPIHEFPGCEIIDARDDPSRNLVVLQTKEGAAHEFDQILIATGHRWSTEDRPEQGFYASPWPISKLLPQEGQHHNFAVGTLGASLSAFDVIASLAHRHGDFIAEEDGRFRYEPHPGTEDFQFFLHASQGMLPHLQFSVENLTRTIYRHIGRDALLDLVDENGFLRLETYFDQVCRPALSEAFAKDGLDSMVTRLADPAFGLKEFVETMSDKHDYEDAFLGMRHEMFGAKESALEHKPIHWKETIDDLIYTLNFHAELMPAEDHLVLKSLVMPFLMNVIAAMPLESGHKLLALYDAGKVIMVSGKVTIADEPTEDGMTRILIREGEQETTRNYRLFIDCSGQKPLELEDYPFPSLVKAGLARKARARFANPATAAAFDDDQKNHLFQDNGETLYHIGGIDIDGSYRLLGPNGRPHPRIHDIAFPHASGVRPYSYGLQSCSDTGAILIRAWLKEIQTGEPLKSNPEETTRVYEEV